MSISIGVVGKPNAGKSTFFSALTMADAKIASFPFTTIEPNRAIAYVRRKCPHLELGKKCEPRDSSCVDGIRFIPIQITDVAGLVPEAHRGKGLGLQFLDDIRQADGLIQVVDASGKTDLEGNACDGCNPAKEVEFLEKEITYWIYGIIERNWNKIRGKPASALYDIFSAMKITNAQVEERIKKLGLAELLNWTEEQKFAFADEMRKIKPIFIAANKWDSTKPETAKDLMEKNAGKVIACASAYELALRKAAKAGVIEYTPGAASFKIINANEEQRKALDKIREYLEKNKSTGVQDVLENVVNNMLGLIAVYPVEDEHKWSDRKGAVLPNVFLLPKNTTVLQLAERVHTDLAKNFIAAVDARKKLKIGKDYILNDGDIIKIISS